MARSDTLVKLFKAGSQADLYSFRKAAELLIEEERTKKHHILADRLMESMGGVNGSRKSNVMSISKEVENNLLFEKTPQLSFTDLILPPHVKQACDEIVEEQHRTDLLHSYGLEPRHKLLLSGVPGNGKTSLAEALATQLMYPLYTVRYESLIGSYLGETASRLGQLFDFIKARRCVLFFDEFDAIGKERGDTHETGEIKRVVSSLLLQMDELPSYVVVVTASNHSELLDRAVWRRFDVRVDLPNPSRSQICKFVTRFAQSNNLKIGYAPETIAKKLLGYSFSEVEKFCLDILRKAVLSHKVSDAKSITLSCLKQWQHRIKPKT